MNKFGGASAPGKYSDGKSTWEWCIPGFKESLHECLGPYVDQSNLSIQQLEERIGMKIVKAAKPFNDDARCTQRQTNIFARYIIEDFVHKAMDGISAGFYEQPWLYKVNFTGPLLATALNQFTYTKMLSRSLAPAMEKYVEDAIFTWAEEERVNKAICDALEECGATGVKKASRHLLESYNEAHFKAPYGSHRIFENPEIGMLMDFVKGWMQDFTNRGVGVITSTADKGQEVVWLAMLFQNLCSPERACLPHELTAMIKEPPTHPWPFIHECAMDCWMSYLPNPNSKSAKKRSQEAAMDPAAAVAQVQQAQQIATQQAVYQQQQAAAQQQALYLQQAALAQQQAYGAAAAAAYPAAGVNFARPY